MKNEKRILINVIFTLLFFQLVHTQESRFNEITLDDLSAFQNTGENWIIAKGLLGDFLQNWDLKNIESGNGIIVNNMSERHRSHLLTKKEFEDVEIMLDFMMDKGSNSGIYLQGRYEVQLRDSWLIKNPLFSDCSGIYQRWDNSRKRKGYEGIAPLSNASRAPGLWQQLHIKFRAPRFDKNGKKIKNARFDEVYLNGFLVQQQVEVSGPTRSSVFSDEKDMGPIVIQGDHGNVAFRNIRYRTLSDVPQPKFNGAPPIKVGPDKKAYVIRSFKMFEDKKLSYVISVGNVNGPHFSYNLENGALLEAWRGDFLDVTDMWHARGEAQLSKPLGSVVSFSNTPTFAKLGNKREMWPDTVVPNRIKNDKYELDKEGIPTFKYSVNGNNISDKIVPLADKSGLKRTIIVKGNINNFFCRLVSAKSIENINKELFRIDGSYYLKVNKKFNTKLRNTEEGQELILELKDSSPCVYSIIW